MSTESETPAPPRRRLIVLLPLLVFLGLAGLFLLQLLSGRDEAEVPSALLGLPAPQTNLPALEGSNLPGLDSKTFAGKVTLVNVFASWCAPCREEHPVLLALSQDKRFVMAALNYKDEPQNARRFLGDLGNPFQAIGVDAAGRTAIDCRFLLWSGRGNCASCQSVDPGLAIGCITIPALPRRSGWAASTT